MFFKFDLKNIDPSTDSLLFGWKIDLTQPG